MRAIVLAALTLAGAAQAQSVCGVGIRTVAEGQLLIRDRCVSGQILQLSATSEAGPGLALLAANYCDFNRAIAISPLALACVMR